MNREFFYGHKVAVIHLCFIENGPGNIVSVDMNGHIFIWKYDKSTVTSKQCFDPIAKYRIDMAYNKFIRGTEKKLFPAGKDNIDPAKALKDKMLSALTNYV